ncbi:hypothetical protein [Clostridium thermarum]|uniref:hypothetical protein n=1 Tax=Clostridium thermarum TaxID=1716543 RepID=UPI0013D49116|nr:hypothetical protein [Clostridium thermarum]
MRVKVLRTFRDKETKTLHRKGKEIEITKKRFEEVNSTAFGVLVEEIKEKKAAKK